MFYLLVGRGLAGRRKAQEQACEGAEDQVEAQRLPKRTAGNTGGHQRIRQQQDGCPASQKERRSQGRLPPGSVEHANERVQTRDVEESAERGKSVNPTAACPAVPPCRPEACEFPPSLETMKYTSYPTHLVA